MTIEAEEITRRINEKRERKNTENNDSQGNSNKLNLARKSERLVQKEKIVYYDEDKVIIESEKNEEAK